MKNIDNAALLTFSAAVIHGRRLGHTLGFPTVNQIPPACAAELPCGVYFSRCNIDGIIFPAVSNLGVKPTVDDSGSLLCETHIFMHDRDLYGRTVTTSLLCFSRGERNFASEAELASQLSSDIANAKEYFGL